jgi:hypothetical protein
MNSLLRRLISVIDANDSVTTGTIKIKKRILIRQFIGHFTFNRLPIRVHEIGKSTSDVFVEIGPFEASLRATCAANVDCPSLAVAGRLGQASLGSILETIAQSSKAVPGSHQHH